MTTHTNLEYGDTVRPSTPPPRGRCQRVRASVHARTRHGLWFPRQHARYSALHRSVRFRAALRVVSFGTVCASGAFDRIPTQHAGGELCALNPCSSSVLSDAESVGAAGPRGIRRLGNVHRLGRVGVGRVGVGRVGHRLRLVLREFGVAVIRLVGHVRIVPRWVPQLMEPLEEPLGKGRGIVEDAIGIRKALAPVQERPPLSGGRIAGLGGRN